MTPAHVRTTLLVTMTLAGGSIRPPQSAAQRDALLRRGATVRVTLPGAPNSTLRVVEGRLVRLEHDTVSLVPAGRRAPASLVSLGLDGGGRLEVWEQHADADAGTLLGAAAGAMAGAAIGFSYCDVHCIGGNGAGATVGAVVGVIGGALAGRAIGSAIKSGRWVEVRTAGLRVTVAPGRLELRRRF